MISRVWERDGNLARLHHALFVAVRELTAKEASPTTAIVDSQSVKGVKKEERVSTLRATRAKRPRQEAAHRL